MERVTEFFKNLMQMAGRMAPGQVMLLLGVVAGSVVGIIFVVGWLNDMSYAPLYSQLEQSEAGEIVGYLEQNNIPYKLSGGGNTIEIPSEQVYKTRLALASEGLPSAGSVGYSIFDGNNLGMTDFLQDLNFRRALEGELTRTIMQLNEVEAARVHIVMPKERLFKSDQKDATASVVLKMRGSRSLSEHQIAGITHLIASSVEGLKPQRISIVDYGGNLLSGGTDSDPLAGLSGSQLQVRKKVETYLQEKAQSMLDEVLGEGKSVVRVTADLNFQQIERTSETFDPNAPSVRSEERVRTSQSTSDKSNELSESKEDGSNETVITNYELNKTVEHIINALGTIDRLSVAVLVDGVYQQMEGADGALESIYQPRPQEELDRLASIVRNAVGFDGQRNDQIEMVNIAFDRENLEQDRQALDDMYVREFYFEVARKVGLVLLAIIALLWVRKRIRNLGTAMGRLIPPSKQVVVAAPALSEQPEARPEVPIKIEAIRPEERKPRLLDKMHETAKKEPEEIAKVIRTLMTDI